MGGAAARPAPSSLYQMQQQSTDINGQCIYQSLDYCIIKTTTGQYSHLKALAVNGDDHPADVGRIASLIGGQPSPAHKCFLATDLSCLCKIFFIFSLKGYEINAKAGTHSKWLLNHLGVFGYFLKSGASHIKLSPSPIAGCCHLANLTA